MFKQSHLIYWKFDSSFLPLPGEEVLESWVNSFSFDFDFHTITLELKIQAALRMSIKFEFVANISRLFTEHKLIERFQVAKDAGFMYLEITDPLIEIGYTAEQLAEAQQKAGTVLALMNVCTGSFTKKEFGLAARPDKKEAFLNDLELGLKYANAMKPKQVHVMAGIKDEHLDFVQMEATYKENLFRAASEFAKIGVAVQIEFICHQTIPKYFLSSGSMARKLIDEVCHQNLFLQLDIYHLQMTEGNLTEAIKHYLPLSQYIQVSQAPSRREPSFPGEIDYKYIFALLIELEFSGFLGLEYSPSSSTDASFEWMRVLKTQHGY